MILSRLFRWSMISALFMVVSFRLSAQEVKTDKIFEPETGQAGKDVIWVPTPQVLVEKMLDIAKVTSEDFVIDLGSGDGRTVIAAAKRGARAMGIEYDPNMVEISRRNAADEGVSDRAEFIRGDLFEADLSQATVITLFLLTSINIRLRPRLLELKPGTRIVSNTFTMKEWTPDETATVSEDCNSYCKALLWIVPAKVEGTWITPEGELKLSQEYQIVTGTLNPGQNPTTITNGRLNGDQITFSIFDERFFGRIDGDRIFGSIISGQNSRKWEASRIGD